MIIRLNQIIHMVHGLVPTEINRILKQFGHWPIVQKDFQIPGDCLAAIWIADYLATMGILDQGMRELLIEQLHERIASWGPEGPQLSETEDCCIRIADRRFLFFGKDQYLDMTSGETLQGLLKFPPAEKLILDAHAIFLRRQQEMPGAAIQSQNGN